MNKRSLVVVFMLIGFLMMFGCAKKGFAPTPASDCKPVVVAPAPPPAPAPMVAPKVAPAPIIIYFNFDRYNIRNSEQAKIVQAANLLKADPTSIAKLTGHTDPFGSDAYNMKLSERRADAVKKALTAQGIDSRRITTSWAGERQLAVPGLKTKAENEINRRTVVVIELK